MDWERWQRICFDRTDEFRPLRVEIVVAAPVCSRTPWLHFDAILANQARIYAKHWSARPLPNMPTRTDKIVEIPLPVTRDPELRVWRCSCLWPADSDVVPTEAHWVMRPSTEYWFLARPRLVRTQSGHTRMRRERITLWPAAVWEAELEGHPHYVRRLVERIAAIGKKRSQGYGRVIHTAVTELDRPARWREWDGCAARPIPHPDGPETGVRPPYWHRPWWEPAIEPGVEL